MRSYRQFCGLAKALDVVGDRWSLLIVRELLLRGPLRYTDLQHGLPNVASNLLVDRLRDLTAAGVIERQEPVPPVATALFALTQWGEQLRPTVLLLGEWAGRLMAKPKRGDRYRSHWLAMPLENLLTDRDPHKAPVQIEIRVDDEPITVETAEGGVRVRLASVERPDAILTGSPEVIIALLTGRIDVAAARKRSLRLEGDPEALRRVRPLTAR